MGIIFFLATVFVHALCGCHAAPIDEEERAYLQPPHGALVYTLGGHTQDLWGLEARRHVLYATPRFPVRPANHEEQRRPFFETMGSASVLDVMNKTAPLPPCGASCRPHPLDGKHGFIRFFFLERHSCATPRNSKIFKIKIYNLISTRSIFSLNIAIS